MPIFDTGTKTIFQQTTAPTGWTKDTVNYNNHCLRVVSGSVSSGGSVDFTTVFTTASFTNVNFPMTGTFGATTLTTPNIPPHQHPISPTAPTWPAPPGVGPSSQTAPSPTSPSGRPMVTNTGLNDNTLAASPAYGGGSHTHPFAISVSGSCGDLSVKYVDIIICTKN
jgi:hypothetical protein